MLLVFMAFSSGVKTIATGALIDMHTSLKELKGGKRER
jgi:hypothetical protein